MRKDWEIKKLGDVCELYQPKTISSKEMIVNGKYSVFGANGIIGKYDKYNHEEPQLLITCRGATCGSVNISLPKSWINGNAMVVRPLDKTLDLKFVEYLFRGGIDITKIITGAAQPQITRQNLSPILIRYPKSIKEQKIIVSILDDAFESIERAKSNAEQNLKNTKELFDSYLQKIFVNKEDDWEEKTLGELCYKITDGSHNPPKGIDYSAYLMLSSRDIYEEQIHFNKPRYLSKKDFESENKRTAIQAGDVLLTIVGTIGRVAVVPTEFPNFTLQRSVAVLKPNNHIINSYFLKFILQNSLSLLISESRGAAQKGIYLNQLKMIKISIPLISKQHQIVKMLDLLFEETKKLESLYLQKLNDLEELKKSVLLKAFNGELRTSKISA
jgi:type I restriction enzyme S subunit